MLSSRVRLLAPLWFLGIEPMELRNRWWDWMKIYFFGHVFSDGSLIRESAGLGRVFFVEGEGPNFLEASFRMDCDLYQRNHQKDVMFSHTRTSTKYWYHSMRCFWCFPKDETSTSDFLKVGCTKVFSTHFYESLGLEMSILSEDCWVPAGCRSGCLTLQLATQCYQHSEICGGCNRMKGSSFRYENLWEIMDPVFCWVGSRGG